jgi:hypothetical protein
LWRRCLNWRWCRQQQQQQQQQAHHHLRAALRQDAGLSPSHVRTALSRGHLRSVSGN